MEQMNVKNSQVFQILFIINEVIRMQSAGQVAQSFAGMTSAQLRRLRDDIVNQNESTPTMIVGGNDDELIELE